MCINRRLNQSFDIWWADKKVVKENVSIIGRTFDQITKLEMTEWFLMVRGLPTYLGGRCLMISAQTRLSGKSMIFI